MQFSFPRDTMTEHKIVRYHNASVTLEEVSRNKMFVNLDEVALRKLRQRNRPEKKQNSLRTIVYIAE